MFSLIYILYQLHLYVSLRRIRIKSLSSV